MADIIYTKVMPTASEAEFGKKYKYMGETTDSFVKGKIYECTTGPRIAYGWLLTGHGIKVWTEREHPKVNDIVYSDNMLKNRWGGNSYVIRIPSPTQMVAYGSSYEFDYHSELNNVVGTMYIWAEYQRPEVKYFSQANVAYLLSELTERIKQSHINE